MPRNIGRYQQGGISTRPNTAPAEAGVPNRAKPAGPVPRSQQHDRLDPKSSGANDKHMH